MSANCRTCQFYDMYFGCCECRHSPHYDESVQQNDACEFWELWGPLVADDRALFRHLKRGDFFLRSGKLDIWLCGYTNTSTCGSAARIKDGLIAEVWDEEIVEPVKVRIVKEDEG